MESRPIGRGIPGRRVRCAAIGIGQGMEFRNKGGGAVSIGEAPGPAAVTRLVSVTVAG